MLKEYLKGGIFKGYELVECALQDLVFPFSVFLDRKATFARRVRQGDIPRFGSCQKIGAEDDSLKRSRKTSFSRPRKDP